jgi:hypothetical protein
MNQPQISPAVTPVQRVRPLGIIIAACLMIVFGLAEVFTAFSHNFFGITTSSGGAFTVSSAAIGLCYVGAGALVLTMRRWAAAVAIILLGLDIVGRIVLVMTGLFPTNSPKNTFSIIAGTVIAALFAIYIGWRWKTFG